MSETMRALVLRQHGGLENLELVKDHPKPKAKAGAVVIRVRASSFNYHDVFTVQGMPGIKVPLPVVIGLDMAGEIVEIGEGVSGWKTGDSRARQSAQQEERPDGRDARRRHGGVLPCRSRPADRHARRRQLRAGRLAAGSLRHRAPHADHPQHRAQGRARTRPGRQRRRRHRLRHPRASCSAPKSSPAPAARRKSQRSRRWAPTR